jgi:hypothetical protein
MLWGVFSLGFVYSDMIVIVLVVQYGQTEAGGTSKHVIASSKPEFVLTGPGGGGGATALSYCSRREQRENDAGIGR